MDGPAHSLSLTDLDRRSREVFGAIVRAYLESGEPIGSRTLSKSGVELSPASIRNTMADLMDLGLLSAPHSSAGRLPTHQGLRLFVDGLLEKGAVAGEERAAIEAQIRDAGDDVGEALARASDILSGLAGGAGLVVTPQRDAAVRHVEFVALGPGEALAVIVFDNGDVENRVMAAPAGVTPSHLTEAGNYLSQRLKGRTLAEAHAAILAEVSAERAEIDRAAAGLIATGLAEWSGDGDQRALIVRGQAQLLNDLSAMEDVERVRLLLDDIERKEGLISLLDQARDAQAVRIFIGAENPLFSLSGSSVVAAPYMGKDQKLVGALGVIGPTRLNYARVIPLVDHTAKVVSALLEDRGGASAPTAKQEARHG